MRVAILADWIDKPVMKDGQTAYASNLVKGLFARGIDLTLLYADIPTTSRFDNIKKESYRVLHLPLLHESIRGRLINHKGRSFDILHETTNYGMPSGKSKAKKIVTLHDVGPLVYPHLYRSYSVDKFRHEIPRMLRNTDAIITVSHFQKDQIQEYYGFPSDRIHVVYLGVDTAVFHKTDRERIVPEDYILHCGGYNPRKGLDRLIEAVHLLKDRIPHKVYSIGDPNRDNEAIRKSVARFELEDRLVVKTVDSDELVNLYSYASLFVYPSLYEGFGLPPLEAMGCGCPVITSDSTSLGEIYENTALTVSTINVVDLADKIYEALSNGPMRNDLIKRGSALADKLRWEYTVEKTINVYSRLLD